MPAEFSTFAGSRSGLQFQRRYPRRRQTAYESVQFDTVMLASFKCTPSFKPEEFKIRRPLMGRCCSCMPSSKNDIVEPSAAELGMRNILDVKSELRNQNVFVTPFDTVVYALRRPLFGPYPNLSMAVLTNRRVIEAVQNAARYLHSEHDNTDRFAVVEKTAVKIISKMKASVSTVFIKFTGWFLLKFLSLMLRGVLVQKRQMSVLKKAAERGMPVIYLPLHRSHLDYVLITFILWNYDIRAPHVAAGENMAIPFFSLLMRSLGGFFIRRRLDNSDHQKDIVYRTILQTYMLELLKKGESLEFFMEGGRTRTGRAIIPKGGLLSVVAEACARGVIPDAYIVPITISYDKLLEGNFTKEQMGGSKKRESFGRACRAILGTLFGDFGSVRIDFAQPFSLQEFLKSARHFPASSLNHSFRQSDSSLSGLNLSFSLPSMSADVEDSENTAVNMRQLVNALAEHTVYTSVHMLTPMCSHSLAFLLLTKYRQGETVTNLAQSLDWLKEQLFVRGQDVGFCGASEDVVLLAQSLLGDDAVEQSYNKEDQLVLKPNLSLPAIFQLSYHASSITTTFALESIIACAVILEGGLTPSMWTPQLQINVMPVVTRDSILNTAEQICILMHAEFILVPPCRRITDALVEILEDFISMEILLVEKSQFDGVGDQTEKQWAARLSKSLAFDEEEYMEGECFEQQRLKVNVCLADIRSKLQFLHLVLAPILESYFITALYITQSLEVDMPEDYFLMKLGEFAQERAMNKLVMNMESCDVLTLKNAVKTFQNLQILDAYKEANLSMICLTDFDVQERLDRYIEILRIARF